MTLDEYGDPTSEAIEPDVDCYHVDLDCLCRSAMQSLMNKAATCVFDHVLR